YPPDWPSGQDRVHPGASVPRRTARLVQPDVRPLVDARATRCCSGTGTSGVIKSDGLRSCLQRHSAISRASSRHSDARFVDETLWRFGTRFSPSTSTQATCLSGQSPRLISPRLAEVGSWRLCGLG